MLQQALDFQTESDALYRLLEPLADADFERKTQFKNWTINHVLQHLHYFNYAADLSVKDEAGILKLLKDLQAAVAAGETVLAYTDRMLDGLKGRALLKAWKDYYTGMLPTFHGADPKMRVKWAGPDMSVLSSITARLMETWAHAQEVYDLLGVVRQDGDHIRNIVVIGNNTFGWTFINRGEPVPADKPYLLLTAPSGAIWEFNEPSTTNRIEGPASEFCQVVTQTRNIADTTLKTTGETATRWMAVAQCFAGVPQQPPAPGTRFTRAA
ncbi:MAG: TIGR03084 family metal-binding protein [Pseudomonadota bacterium]|nr:TIGR03084 family metal-binding protein [Pseudomonadota bacterium]